MRAARQTFKGLPLASNRSQSALRNFTTCRRRREQPRFPGYELDALDAPLASRLLPRREPPPALTEEGQNDIRDDSPAARAQIVFSSRLEGPAQRRKEIAEASTLVAGVIVPPRPEEPENCCMSGCVNCVWDRYREELEEWADRKKESEEKLHSMPQDAYSAIDATSQDTTTMSKTKAEPEVPTDLLKDIPVGIREFMKMEKRIRAREELAEKASKG